MALQRKFRRFWFLRDNVVAEPLFNEFFHFYLELIKVEATLIVSNWDFSIEYMADSEFLFRQHDIRTDAFIYTFFVSLEGSQRLPFIEYPA